MGVRERYEANKKKKDEEQKVFGGVRDRYLANSARDVGESLTSRINTWFTYSNDYATRWQKKMDGFKGTYEDAYDGASSEWLSTITSQKNFFDTEAASIKSVLDEYKNYLDPKWVSQVISALDSASGHQEDILKASTEYSNYWSQWETEDAYKEWSDYMANEYKKQTLDLDAEQAKVDKLQELKNEMLTSAHPLKLKELQAWYEAEYGGIPDIRSVNSTLSEASSFLSQAQRTQDAARLASAKDSADFAEYSQKGAAIENPTGREAEGWFNIGEWHPFGKDVGNIVTYSRDNAAEILMGGENMVGDYRYSLMTEDEVDIYNYYLGKGDKASADRYLETLEDSLNQRMGGVMYDATKANAVTEAISYVMMPTSAGIDQFTTGIEGIFADGYKAPSAVQYAGQEMREDLKNVDLKYYNIADQEWQDAKIFGNSLGQVYYDGLTTTANMLPSILVSQIPGVGQIAGAGLLGASAAGNAKQEMLNLGYSASQANFYALMVGASEAGLQYALGGISQLGGKLTGKALTGVVDKIDNAIARIAVKWGGKMASEALEEGLQTVLEPWFKSIVGLDFEAANIDEILYSSLLGALSAGFLEGGGVVANDINTQKTGKKVQGIEGGRDTLVQLGETMSADSAAYKIASRVNEKTGAYTIGRLFQEVGATLSEQNYNDIVNGLTERGVDSRSARTLAKVYQQFLNNEMSLSDEAVKILENAEPLTDVLRRKIVGANTTVYQRTRQYTDLYNLANEISKGETSAEAPTEAQDGTKPDTPTDTSPYTSDEISAIVGGVKADMKADATLSPLQKSIKDAVRQFDAQAKAILKVNDEYTSSDTGTVRLKSNNQKVTITDIASNGENGLMLKLNDGSVVNAKEVNFSTQDEALVYEAVANMDVSPATAWAIIKGYDPKSGQSGAVYALGAIEGYSYGNLGLSATEKGSFYSDLTADQRARAHQLGAIDRTARVKAEQKAIDEKRAQAKKDGAKRRKGEVVYDKSVDVASLTESQKAQTEIVSKVAEALGTRFHFFASTAHGKTRGFTNADGNIVTANGWYDPKTGEIWVDVNAGISGNGLILNTASHELTHFIKEWSPEKYKVFADFLVEQYGKKGASVEALVRAQIAKAKRSGRDISYDEAFEEVVADSCESFLQDSNASLKIAALYAKDKNLAQKIKAWLGQLLAKVRKLAADLGLAPESVEGKLVAEMTDALEKLHELWTEAAIDAGKAYSETEIIDALAESRDLKYNLRLAEKHFGQLDNKYTSDATIPLATLKNRYDEVIKIWKELGGELNSEFLKAWDAKQGKDRAYTVFKEQAGYKYNVELASMCKKGVPLFEAIDYIVKKEVMSKLKTGTIGKAEKEILYDVLKTHHFEIPCAICYVEQARAREGAIINAFLEGKKEYNKSGKPTAYKLGWNEVLREVQDEMARNGVSYAFPSVDRSIAEETYSPKIEPMDTATQDAFYAALMTITNKEIERYNRAEDKRRALLKNTTPSAIEEAFKGNKPTNLTLLWTLFTEPESRFFIADDLLYSSMTTLNLARSHHALYKLFNIQGGVGGYKLKQGTVVYWGDILTRKWRPETLRKEGGVRNQSNSDFQMYNLLDYAQMYIDFSAKGYYLQAYTKVLAEAKLFGLSRGKINLSLIPKVQIYRNADGTVDEARTRERAGLDESGNPIYDDIEGIPHDEAFMLLSDAAYSKNCGGVCIAYSDAHLSKLLDDSRVQLIIGFHDNTDDPNKRYRGARYAKNYRGENEAAKTKADGTLETVHIGFNQYVQKAEKMFGYDTEAGTGKESITYKGKAYTVDDIPRLAADLYLEMCDKNNYRPAYNNFKSHRNYYKVLADFSLYDSEGHYSPHRKVSYDMPTEVPFLAENGDKRYEDSKEYIKKELTKELSVRDSISTALADKSADGIIPQFIRKVNELHGVKPSLRGSSQDTSYLEAVNSGDMETAQRMVDEAAREAGYDSPKLYHGTPRFGFTKIETAGLEEGVAWSPFFATDSLEVASTYSGSDNVKKISEASTQDDTDRERVLKDIRSDSIDFAEYCNSALGIRGWVDYDYISTKVDDILEELEHSNDHSAARDEFYGFCDELFYSFADNYYYGIYDEKTYSREAFEGSQEYEQLADDFYAHVDDIIGKFDLLDYDASMGIYDLYAKTEGLFEIDAHGNSWSRIPFDSSSGSYLVNTRRLATYARDQGYNGVKITNVFDDGGRGKSHQIKPATVYIFFAPKSQVKSADTVTYDEDGNVIPLSQRFKDDNNDIRYSERDSAYMDAVSNGDMETAQRMVDEAAKEAGYTVKAYHGTGSFGFTKFREGNIYATVSQGVAMGYNRGQGLGRVRSASRRYIENDGTVETAIKNAKNVLGADLTPLDDKARQNIINKTDHILKTAARNVAEIDEATDYQKAGKFFEYLSEKYGEDRAMQWTNELDGLHYLLASEYTAEELLEDGGWFARDIAKYTEWKQSLSDLWIEERKAIQNASLDRLFRYLLGNEYGDALIGIEYGLARLLDDKTKLVNANGSLIYLEDVIDAVESQKNVGIYELYGDVGSKPLVIDEGKVFWDSIPFNGSHHSTDYIVRWARDNDYTSVLFKSVLDPSAGGSANVYADEWVFFNPNQVKSADTVTYDEGGNVIPLSERFKDDNNDIRYSDRDSLGNELSEEQQEYFRDSKVRDKKGNLMVLYHGTNADFTVFEKRKGVRSLGMLTNYEVESHGFFFSPDISYANEFGRKIGAYYVDVKKPLVRDTDKVNLNNLDSKGRTAFYDNERVDVLYHVLEPVIKDALDYQFEHSYNLYEDTADNVKIKKRWALKDLWEHFDGDIFDDMSLPWEVVDNKHFDECISRMTELGYDGFMVNEGEGMPNSWFVISSNQAKLTTNKAPTSNPDIRFSERDPAEVSNRELLASSLEGATQNDIEKKKLANYKKKVDLLNAEEAKLAELNGRIRELSFAKGKRDTATLKRLKDEAVRTEARINTYDRQLLTLEASKPLKDILTREKALVRKQEKAKTREAVSTARKTAAQKARTETEEYYREMIRRNREKAKESKEKAVSSLKEEYRDRQERAAERRSKTDMRQEILKVVEKLDFLIKTDTKNRHVLDALKPSVIAALEVINRDTVDADARVAAYNERIANEADELTRESLIATRDRIQRQGENLTDKLTAMQNIYDGFAHLTDAECPKDFKENATLIVERIKSVKEKVGDTPIRNMSLPQLEAVYDLYKMVLTTVRQTNKMWRLGKLEDVQTRASDILLELSRLKSLPEERPSVSEKLRKLTWDELTPVYAFERIGSETFTELFWDAIEGQNTYARDVEETHNFAEAVREKYGYKDWDFNKVYPFKTTDGRQFRLTLGHMMSIYAYSKRPQASDHMLKGGFFFNDKTLFRTGAKGLLKYVKSNSEGYKMDATTLDEIIEAMGNERIAYVDEMQRYLSDTMAAKGNEVSEKLWGIQLFKEKVYFPLKSKEDFIAQNTETSAAVSLKNDGMTKETVPHASNPIVLEAFDDVWARHCDRMSQYHAFVIPIDNINKVHHYGTWADSASVSVSTVLNGKFGGAVNEYLKQFITDLNGGAVVKGVRSPLMGFFSKFKKTAVAASLSVVVQQPTAIIRALAEMNPKYFASAPRFDFGKQWAELKKYAPIAVIKEIGGFDAGSGRQSTDYINAETKRGLDKAMSKLDDISMKGAEWGDVVGWVTIWNAVKKEIASTTDLEVGSEEFLEAAGDRFTEVVVRTQVYDSTLSRSAFMRSKSDVVKMSTSFMGEPTQSFNMMFNAVLNAMRGGKEAKAQAVRTISAVYASVALASAAASAIYALRNDDDDEAYLEKWAFSFGEKLVSDLNPLNMLPFTRDIMSLLEGWDVERTDISVFADIISAFGSLDSDTKSPWRKFEDLTGAIASAFGIPAKNMLRTGREIFNAVRHIADDIKPTDIGGSFIEGVTGNEKTTSDKLYRAVVSGDEARIAKIKAQYKDESAYETAVRKALRENDSRIKEAATARYEGDIAEYKNIVTEIVNEGFFSQDIVVGAVNAEIDSIEESEIAENPVSPETEADTEEATSIYKADDINTAFDGGDTALALEIIDDLIATKVANGMTEERARSSLKSSMTSYWKPLYKEAYKNKDTEEMKRIRETLYASGLYGRASDVLKSVKAWLKEKDE